MIFLIPVNAQHYFDQKMNQNRNHLVLSSHHQAIEDLASEYRITAVSIDDEIIEGIAHEKYPNVIGIQFSL